MINKIRTLVKAKRMRYDIDLRKAAEYIGITHTTLYRFEQGKPTSAENFLKIAKWLDYTMQKINTRTDTDTYPGYRDEMETAHVESSSTIASMPTDKEERIDRLIWKIQGMNKESEWYEEELKEVRAEMAKMLDQFGVR